MARRLGLVTSLMMTLSLAGCSSEPPVVMVRGKVHKNGAPLAVKESATGAGGRVMVLFHPMDSGGKPADAPSAIVKADGTFSLPGAAGRGIAPGKYRVEVKWQDPYPMGKDKLDGKFGKDSSPVVVEVPGAGDIDIDVARVSSK